MRITERKHTQHSVGRRNKFQNRTILFSLSTLRHISILPLPSFLPSGHSLPCQHFFFFHPFKHISSHLSMHIVPRLRFTLLLESSCTSCMMASMLHCSLQRSFARREPAKVIRPPPPLPLCAACGLPVVAIALFFARVDPSVVTSTALWLVVLCGSQQQFGGFFQNAFNKMKFVQCYHTFGLKSV